MSDVDLQFNLSMSINSEHEEDQKESCSEEDMLFSEGEEGSFEDNSEDEKRLPLILTPSPPASVPAPETPPASVPAPVPPPPASVPAPETPPRQRKSGIFDIDGFTPERIIKGKEESYQQRMRNTFDAYVNSKCNGRDNVEIDDDDIKQIRKHIFLPDSVIIDYIQKKKSKSIEEYTNIFLNMLKKNHNIFYRQQIEQRRQWAELRRRRAEQQRQQREQREQHRRRRRRKQEEKSEICATCTMQLQQLRF